jgi:hypothetical protein
VWTAVEQGSTFMLGGIWLPNSPPHPSSLAGEGRGGARVTEYSKAVLILDLLEISQVRWSLVLLRRHQVAVPAKEIPLLADFDVTIALGANLLDPLWLPDR